MEKKIVIDADFLNIFLSATDGESLFVEIMEALNFSPCVHQFVKDEELFANNAAQKLINNGDIKVLSYDKIKDFKVSYENEFKRLYRYINGHDSNLGGGSVFTYRKAHENLGEIHSCIMAHILELPYLMSNDKGAKDLVLNRINSDHFEMTVMTYEEFLYFLTEQKTCLSDNIIKGIKDNLVSVQDDNNNYVISKQSAKKLQKLLSTH